jgi:hypothetical protein
MLYLRDAALKGREIALPQVALVHGCVESITTVLDIVGRDVLAAHSA